MRKSPAQSVSRAIAMAGVLGLLAAGVLACGGCRGTGVVSGSREASASQEMTVGQFPESEPTPGKPPPPPMLTKPESSVYSYLLWISYAYRVLNSDVAVAAFSPYEEVRVSSYVEYNREQGRAIDQRLVGQIVRSVSSEGATSTVATVDAWKYRYIDIKTGKYSSPIHDASYDSTYTLVKSDKGWLVDSVKATAKGSAPK